ncbi:MAG: VOC family protein [Rhizobiales bacterium]|nr:VOC family protein [Hyphomicrobiales bacterium]
MSSSHGTFVWYELMTTDTKAAENFYHNVIGWDAKDAGMPGVQYTLLSANGTQVAGLMELPKAASEAGARSGWNGYVAVDDVDARATQFEKAGGHIHRAPDDIPGVGRFAMVSDPQGAVLALFKGAPGSEAPPAASATPGYGGWRELQAAEWQAAFAFYADLFGWTKAEAVDMGPMGVYQIFAIDGEMIGGMMTKPEAVPAPFWLYYFNIDAIEAAKTRVEARGGKIVNGPHQVPGGSWIVHCLDPQGAMFALVGPRL